jgi:hypothetical protein
MNLSLARVYLKHSDQVASQSTWQPQKLLHAIRNVEASIPHRLVTNLGRKSAFPRIRTLHDLLKAKA